MNSLFSHSVNDPSVIYARNGLPRTKKGRRNTLQRVLPLLELCNPMERVEMWKAHRSHAGSFQIMAVHVKTIRCTYNHRTLVQLLAFDGSNTILDVKIKPRETDGCIEALDNCPDLTFGMIEGGCEFGVAKNLFLQLLQTNKYAIIWAGMNVLEDAKSLGRDIPEMCCLLDLSYLFRYKERPMVRPKLSDLCEQILNVKFNNNFQEIIYALAKRLINHGDVCILEAPFWVERNWNSKKIEDKIYKLKLTGLKSEKFEEELNLIFKNEDCQILKTARMADGNDVLVEISSKLPYKCILYSTMGFTFEDERSITIEKL